MTVLASPQDILNLQRQVDQSNHVIDMMFWILVCQLIIMVGMIIFIVAFDRKQTHDRADYFAGYHQHMHEEMNKLAIPLLPKRSLESSKPVPETDTAEQAVLVGAGRHRSDS